MVNTTADEGNLVQERRNSSVLAMELCLSCTKPSIHLFFVFRCAFPLLSIQASVISIPSHENVDKCQTPISEYQCLISVQMGLTWSPFLQPWCKHPPHMFAPSSILSNNRIPTKWLILGSAQQIYQLFLIWLRLEQDGCQCADEILHACAWMDIFLIFNKISLKCFHKGAIDIKSTLIQVMAWHLYRCQAINWINDDPFNWHTV